HRLAWQRFSSDQIIRYHAAMVALLREHSEGQFVTHNFIPASDTAAVNSDLASPLDFPSYDSYPLGRTDLLLQHRLAHEEFARYQRTGHPDLNALTLDQTRGLGPGGFWIMEQQPGPVNWAKANPAPAPGMIRLWVYEAFAHGADCVSFFRWRQAPFAQEQMHAGLLRRDDEPSRRWPEIATTIAEIEALKLADVPTQTARVALLVDAESEWITNIERQSDAYSLPDVQFDAYRALRSFGLSVDFVEAHTNFEQYDLVVVPCLAVIGDDFVARARRSEATFLFGPRSGSKTTEFQIPATLAPGALGDWLDARVVEVETLRPAHPLRVEWGGTEYDAHCWHEWLESSSADILATCEDGSPALLRKGRACYLTTLPDTAWWTALVEFLCEELGIHGQRLPDTLRLRQRGPLTFALNYGDTPCQVPHPDSAEWILGGPDLAPRDVAVWRTTP
ncbi:MAG: beta-galactosidase, partial [Pseudomonadota bacterium]